MAKFDISPDRSPINLWVHDPQGGGNKQRGSLHVHNHQQTSVSFEGGWYLWFETIIWIVGRWTVALLNVNKAYKAENMTHLVTLLKSTWSDIDTSGHDLGRFSRPEVRPKGPPIPDFLVGDAPIQKISHGDGGRIHITLGVKMSIARHDIYRGTHLNPWT
jgi:hypothetical protein